MHGATSNGRLQREAPAHRGAVVSRTEDLTKGEIMRRTQERSREAARRLAARQQQDRRERDASAARRMAAKALAVQARQDNKVRFRRDISQAGRRPLGVEGARMGGRGLSLPARTSSQRALEAQDRGEQAPCEDPRGVDVKAGVTGVSKREKPSSAPLRSSSLDRGRKRPLAPDVPSPASRRVTAGAATSSATSKTGNVSRTSSTGRSTTRTRGRPGWEERESSTVAEETKGEEMLQEEKEPKKAAAVTVKIERRARAGPLQPQTRQSNRRVPETRRSSSKPSFPDVQKRAPAAPPIGLSTRKDQNVDAG